VRRRGPRRSAVWFAVAAALALLAAVGTLRAQGGGPSARILIAAADLPVGARLEGANLVRPVTVPRAAALPGLLRDVAEVRGRLLAVPVASGEPISDAVLGGRPGRLPGPLARGERAVSVPLATAGGAAAALAPGVRVDVVAATGEGPRGQAAVVVPDAEVLTTSIATGESGAGEGGSVLLRVRRAEALRLAAALDFARDVRLLPRPVAEAPVPSASP
jgi:pilus assembly protein CpaB